MKKNNILSQKEGIFYEGIVTLQQFNKNKKLKKSVTIKNSGDTGLLKFLGYAFSTDFSNISLYCPYAIKGYDGEDKDKESFNDPIPIRSTPTFEITNNTVIITFIFDIPYYLLKNNVSHLDLINKLPSNNPESLCASIDFSSDNIISKDATLTNVIYWTLNFNIN